MTIPDTPQPNAPTEAGLRRVLITLCLTQITSWGVLYDAFPVLAVQITADTDWSPPVVTAAFSAALVTSAVIGIWVGRQLDRRGPHAIMTAGSVLGPIALPQWRSPRTSLASWLRGSRPGSPWEPCSIHPRSPR
jgi:MFS family permease